MKKIFLLFALFSIGAIAFSQEISVRFIGRINDADYCRLDSVAVTNITRNWTETVVYPDTMIVLGGTGNVNLNIDEEQGLGQNIPNPFDCETRVELSVSQRENVRMQLLDVSGKVYAEYNNSLDAGVHTFDISAAAPQTYILNATIGKRSYSIRMVNTGSGCGSSIKYAGISGGIISKQTWYNESQIGDNMRYIGYTNIGGNILESEPVQQPLRENQEVELSFRSGSTGVINGHDYVDLGLPSGICWATCNVGASSPEEYGDYFAWGETTPKTSYDWFTYRYCDGSGSTNTLTKYCYDSDLGYNGFTDNLTTLVASDDAARANWGSSWRMPTRTEMKELLNNCTHIWTSQNGVYGRLFTGPNGNSIFLPAAGLFYYTTLNNPRTTGVYWSSSLSSTYNSLYTCGLFFHPDGYSETACVSETAADRSKGLPVRAVCESANISVPTVTTGTASGITATDATISGDVTSAGGATLTARGFLYGTNASNLSHNLHCFSGTGSYTAIINNLIPNTTYYYQAYATNAVGTAYGEVMSFTTETETASTSYSEPTGYVNGYGYVDLGLPSGTLWATMNVGASTPEGYGDHYAWGETTTKETYGWSTYRYCNGSNRLTKYCSNSSWGDNGFTDNLTTLEASDDAATANWGSGWRMPTETEMYELKNNCTVTGSTQNGVNGLLFTGPNGNSIFLPAAGNRHYEVAFAAGAGSYGYYWSSSLNWSSSPNANLPYCAWILNILSNGGYYMSAPARDEGNSVRPVCISVPNVTTGTASSITATGATLSGNVTFDGGATVTDRGFLYGTNASNLTQTVQSDSGTGSFTSALTGLTSGTTYYYKAYATNSVGTAYGEVRLFIPRNSEVTTGTLNGHDWIDLGLPSGTLWATCNVGATNQEDCGNYYAWGETTAKTTYDWSTYRYCNGSYNTLTKYFINSSFGSQRLTDNLTTLEASDDVAAANWGVDWRMPIRSEMEELYNNCTVTWTTQNGVNGRLFTGPNGNSIFLPAAGYRDGSDLLGAGSHGDYWSSSLSGILHYGGNQHHAWYLYFDSGDYEMRDFERCEGQSVRPVCNGGYIGGNASVSFPTVITNTASNITATSASISGNVTSDGGATVTARGFLYGTNSSNLTQTVQSGSGTSSFTSALTGLTPGTTYYYKAYATNSAGTAYGEVMSFTTVSVPTVTTGTASSITATGATLSGNVTSDGGATVTARGFLYGTNASNLTQTIQSGSGTGSFTKDLTGLTSGTTYYYKAYATNSAGTAYGEVRSFTTESVSVPNVTTGIASSITATGVTLSGNVTSDGGATVAARGFLYGTNASNLTQTVQSGSGTGSFTKSLTGLTPGTTYYYKAYATNSAGTDYGEVMSFTTVSVPTVTTGTASSITATGATLSGNVTSDGGATVTTRGFLYGTNASNLTQTVQSGSGTGSFIANLTGLTSGTTYYYKAFAVNNAGIAYGEVMSFTIASTGTLNGHDWVDLGLPSGRLWATCNVGATNPEDYGNYYAWGETTTKDTYDSSTYTYTGNPTTLPWSADAATANWGANWRMPTYDEMRELINCTVTWTTQNGVNGCLFTGPNGNSIFLPAAGGIYASELSGSDGSYWSSSHYSVNPDDAYYLYFNSDDCGMRHYSRDRYYGFTVRAVCNQ